MKPNLIAKIPPAVWNAKTWLQKQSPDQNGALPACWNLSISAGLLRWGKKSFQRVAANPVQS
jgi:hypothetical protein